MELLDGKKVSQEMYLKLQGEVAILKNQGVHPKLTIILVGEDPASLSYIKQKTKASELIGIESDFIQLKPEEVTTESLIQTVQLLNKDPEVNGILIQLPLPKHISASEVLKAVDPLKDVDGFSAYNIGKMFLGVDSEDLVPCTPLGVVKLLEHYNIEVRGQQIVIVGASNVVGKPLAIMLQNRGATITLCNSKTRDLASQTKRADILVVAVGKPGLITADMVKEGAVVVDVGLNRNADGKLVGDVDFDQVSKKASFISPVPGGCGPMTVAGLMANVVKAVSKQTLDISA